MPLVEMTVEVKIPISDAYISLGASLDCFKEELRSVQRRVRLGGDSAGGPPVVTIALRPQLFLVETYHLRTVRTATGKGPQVKSIPFGPAEEKTITITQSVSSSTSITDTTTAMESQDEQVAKDFNQRVSNASQRSGSQDSSAYDFHGSFHGDASVGLGSGEANAKVDAEGGANSSRRDFSNAVQNAMDQQITHTADARRQNVSEQASSNTQTTSTQVVSTDKVTNPNPTKGVTAIWYQMVEEFTSFLTLDNVDIVYLNAPVIPAGITTMFRIALSQNLTKQERVPLHDLDRLLSEVADPARSSSIREAIKGQLENIYNYQNHPTSIIEPGTDSLRMKENLQSDYVVKDGSGNPLTTMHVDGLLMKVFKNVFPTGNLTLDLVVGAVDAITG